MTDQQSNPADLSPPILVDDPLGLKTMLLHLRKQSVIAVDTESDSLFSYYAKVCLIQISAYARPEDANHVAPQNGSVRGESSPEIVDYLFDPLAFEHIDELNELFADPDLEIIMHAAYNDILTLQREYETEFRNIFDTQLTARILGWERTGLARILEEQFGVISDKRMQRTDWGQRPLEKRQTHYAQLDTHYLLALRKIQLDQLAQANRLEEANEAFKALEDINYHDRPTPERTFWQMKASRDVPLERTAVLEALWNWREKTAQKMDRPPFKVVNDSVLIQMAIKCPKSSDALNSIKGLSPHQRRRFGKALLRAIDRGLTLPQPTPPVQKQRPDYVLNENVMNRYEALREWRTKRARKRGVDPDIVFSNDILLAVAKEAPQSIAALDGISEIGPWKAKTYGAELIDVVTSN